MFLLTSQRVILIFFPKSFAHFSEQSSIVSEETSAKEFQDKANFSSIKCSENCLLVSKMLLNQ